MNRQSEHRADDAENRADNAEHGADEMSFGEHLHALRPHLMRSAGAILLLAVAAFCCKNFLIDGLLFGPLRPDFPTNRLLAWLGAYSQIDPLNLSPTDLRLINTTVAGQFNLHLTVSFAAACALGFPYLLWELWRFVRPALTARERHACRRFVGYVSAGFFVGLAFGYLLIAPLSIAFLTRYTVSERVANLIDVHSYLATVLNVSLACALVFQLPLLVWFLTRMGLLSAEWLRRYRRHAIVVLALLAAVITPPDAFSMMLVLLPLYGLYEASIRIAERTRRRAHFNGESGSLDITQ